MFVSMLLRCTLLFLIFIKTAVAGDELSSGGKLRGDAGNVPPSDNTRKITNLLWNEIRSKMTTTIRGPIVSPGVTVSRTITYLSEGASFYLTLQGNHCTSSDLHGANNCHYDWGDVVNGHYSVQVSQTINEGDILRGNFKIDHIIPYEFSCLLCGSDCVLEVPVININYTLPMPPCPIEPHHVVKQVNYLLQNESPTDGIRTHVDGTIDLEKSNGNLLASFNIDAYLK